MMKYFFLFALLTCIVACKKDNLGERFFNTECMNGYRMPYTNETLVTNYVVAQTSHFGPIKLVSGHSGDSAFVAIAQTVATSDPNLVLNGNYPVSKLILTVGPYNADFNIDHSSQVRFHLEKFSKSLVTTLESFIDSSFLVGSLSLNKAQLSADTSAKIEENFAFNVLIGNCEHPGVWDTALSAIPDQKGTLQCDHFTKTVEMDSIRYQIGLSFDHITLLTKETFEMNDGKMVLDFKIPR
jgi:hypothetical protein